MPSVPGFVREIDVPRNASGSIAPRRAFPTRMSNVATNSAKSSSSASLMFGTRSERVPSFFATSTATPRFTCGFLTRWGLPSASAKASFIPGCFSSALTMAHATRCVKETFDWRTASRWWFRIRRFSSIALTGITRCEVAVGTASEASMFRAIVAEPPTSGTSFSPGRRTGAGAAARGADAAGATGTAVGDAAGARAGTDGASASRTRAVFSNRSNVRRQSSPTLAGFSRYCA